MARRPGNSSDLEAGLVRRVDQGALVLAVAGAAVTLGVMGLVLAVPALDGCAPSGTPALACISQSLRERLPLLAREPESAALVNPPLPPRDPRKAPARPNNVPADMPADVPVIPPAPPSMLKVDLPVLSPIGEARASGPPAELPLATEATLVTDLPIIPSVSPAGPDAPGPMPAESIASATPAIEASENLVAPPVDPVTANAVPHEPAEAIANVTPALPVTLPPNPKPPMPEPRAAASPVPDAEPAPAQPPATEAPVLPPTIDTIQIGGTDNFVAGDAPEGSTVRLYLDDLPAGESDVQDGRWLVEGVELTSAPQQILKVEAIDKASGKVLGTGAISVEIELPDDEDLPPGDTEAEPPPVETPVPAVPDPSPVEEQEAPPPEPVSGLGPHDVPAVETAGAPQPLPPLAAVTPRRASPSVGLLSGSDGGSFITLGK